MNPSLKYLLSVLCFVTIHQTAAQNSQLHAYTIADGLPQSQVYDIVQDDMGYLWLGTQGGGLASFDGREFEVWNEGDGLLSNYIHSLWAQNDSLFIGSNRGLSIKVRNSFFNFKAPRINSFYATEKALYLATQKGVYSFFKNGKLQKLSILPEIDASAINTILFDGTYYWLATNNGLWRLSEMHQEATEITKIDANNFSSLLQHNDKILAATFDDGVFIISVENPDDRFVMPEPPRINSMAIHNENELWIATDDDGITVVETEYFSELKRLNTSNGLAVPHIRKSLADARGNLWIATSGGGFYKYFQNNFKHYDRSSGLRGNRIYAVHASDDGIWVSNSEAGLTKIDSVGVHPISIRNRFADVKIKTITSDAKGNIWAGSDDRGILFRETKMVDSLVVDIDDTFKIRVDTVSKQVTRNHIIDERKGLPSDWIRKIIVTDNVVWAATYASGIVKFEYFSESDSLAILKTFGKNDGITDLLINDFAKDSRGRFWYATQNGHLGYIDDDKVYPLETALKQKTTIGTLVFDQGRLFLGTSGKGIWYADDLNALNVQPLKGAKELSSENIYQLIFDSEGYLWAGTERGVDKIELNEANEITDLYHFDRNDGFLGIETCMNAVDKDVDGNLWFGTIYGLTQFMPSKDLATSVPPKIYFTGITEGYNDIDSLNLKEWTNSDTVLQLTPEQTQLGFSFRTIDLDRPDEIEYRTKLNDTEWSPWVSENKQNFAGLAYGAHTFKVQSRNHRWVESTPIRFQFFIDSPLYQKDWFRWAVLAAVATILAVLGLFYIRKIKARNRDAQERLQMQNYLLTLEQKALRLQMNPHFIFNVLNGIKGMAGNKPEKMNSTINSFATLLRETLQNSRKEFINLDQEIKTLRHYIEVEKLMAPEPFTYSIDVSTEPDAEEILIPPMLIQPFVENAIRHGILKGTRAGELRIAFHNSKQQLHCSIEDNGKGIFVSQSEKTTTDHQSMALAVTKERLESISGPKSLQLTEITNDDGTIAGTKISFAIPLLTDY